MVTHDHNQNFEDVLKGMAIAHNISYDEVILLMEELQQYTEQMKNESQDNLELFEEMKRFSKK